MRVLFAFAAGVAAGLLLAPDSGDKNLEKMKAKLSDWGEDLEGKLKEQFSSEEEEEEKE